MDHLPVKPCNRGEDLRSTRSPAGLIPHFCSRMGEVFLPSINYKRILEISSTKSMYHKTYDTYNTYGQLQKQ